MITPDDKDWTWVLREPCPDCGFDAASCSATAVAGLIRANGRDWRSLLDAGHVLAGRTDPTRWSTLEYAAHVRDVYDLYDQRLVLMVEQEDPRYPNWDQDATAVQDRYDEQDPATVVADLVANAERIADRFDALSPEQWSRPGRRSDGASFTIDTFSRYLVHDPIHHLWDVTR